jgi:nucleotide-binding universal stress UspA family protein
MYDDILIPTDGSEEVETAIEHAFELAGTYDATVHALYVVDNSRGGTGLMGSDTASAPSELRTIGEEAINGIATRGEESGLTIKTEIHEALPHEGILNYADEHDIDLLVMSSRGRSGVSRFVFGSVTERVVRLSGRPVLVVSREMPDDENA